MKSFRIGNDSCIWKAHVSGAILIHQVYLIVDDLASWSSGADYRVS